MKPVTDISSNRFQGRTCWWGSKLGGFLTGPLMTLVVKANWRSRALPKYQWLCLNFDWSSDHRMLSLALCTVHLLEHSQWRIIGPQRQDVGPSSGPSPVGSLLSLTQKDGIWLESIGFSLDPYWWKKKDQQQWVLECFVNSSWLLLLMSSWGLGRPVLILVICSPSWQSKGNGIADSREKPRKTGGG